MRIRKGTIGRVIPFAPEINPRRQEDCKVNKQEVCPQMTRMNADEEEETR